LSLLSFGSQLFGLACASQAEPVKNAAMDVTADDGAGSDAPAPHTDATRLTSVAGTKTSSTRSRPSKGRLSVSRVGAAVRAHQDDFYACQALAGLESLRQDGAVKVGWLVNEDGSVEKVRVGASTFKSAKVNDCVLSVARNIHFPASAASTEISWTVEFRGVTGGPVADVGSRYDGR
jgi:outer membrane biosynthesis protein TonB